MNNMLPPPKKKTQLAAYFSVFDGELIWGEAEAAEIYVFANLAPGAQAVNFS